MKILQVVAGMAIAAVAVTALRAQTPPRSAKEGVYTKEQADRGKAVYGAQCASCHGTMETVTPDMAPLLNDSGFQNLWKDRSLARLFGRIIETMPQDKPKSLSPDQTAEIVAYILSGNQLPAGDVPLPTDLEVLKEIRVDAGEP
jgi:mono/diheme cytochrome c family protein